MERPIQGDELPRESRLAFRLVILTVSIGVAIIATSSLIFVWEMRIDGEAYRRLLPDGLVHIMLVGISAVGLILFLIEVVVKPSVRVAVYPIAAVLYVTSLFAFLYLFLHGFAMSRDNPLATSEQSAAAKVYIFWSSDVTGFHFGL